MLRKLTLFIILFSLIWVASGCKTLQKLQEPKPEFSSEPFELNPPNISSLAYKDLPQDIRLVTAAVIKKMRQEPGEIPGVEFESPDSHYSLDKDFDYQGFSVTNIKIINHWAKEAGNGRYNCKLHGVIAFGDVLGRRALVDYIVYYRLRGKKQVIVKSQVMPIAPAFPHTQAFFVQAQKLKEIMAGEYDFTEFYARVVNNAYSMTPTSEEIKEKQELAEMNFFERLKNSSGLKRKDNFMVIFVMDRLTPDAELDVVVSRHVNGMQSLTQPVYMNFSGWRTAVFGGNFALDKDKFYTKVFYKPEQGVLPEGKEQVLIGLFCSEKNYSKEMAGEQGGKATSVAAVEGPLASGSQLLDVSDKNDAALVQSRLAELGFYKMKIDGLWGPGSKSALKEFQASNGLYPTGEWGIGTQIKLFAGTGR